MLKIVTKRELLSNTDKVLDLPYKRFNTVLNYEKGISKDIEDIINEIDKCKVSHNNLISKFTNSEIDISKISDGSKTVAYVMMCYKRNYTCEVIDITSCGPNAIKYILEHFDHSNLKLYLGHYDMPEGIKCKIKFNDKIIYNTDEIYK